MPSDTDRSPAPWSVVGATLSVVVDRLRCELARSLSPGADHGDVVAAGAAPSTRSDW